MKKIILVIIMMFASVNFVFASNEIMIDVINVSGSSVTLEVNVSDTYSDDICYLYRSIDGINYDNQIMINCNKMYVDKELELGMTYYYRAKYDGSDDFSEVVTISTDNKEVDSLKLTRNVNSLSVSGLGFAVVLGLLMLVLVTCMFLFKKKIN